MKKFDFYFSIICAVLVAEIVRELGYFYFGILFLFLPILTLFCFWLAEYIGKKYLFVFQVAKHVLAGIFATVIDYGIFNLLFSFFELRFISKSFSYVVSAFVKYLFNKFWSFEKLDTKISHEEFIKFLLVNVVGLTIDVSCFAILTKYIGPQFGASVIEWTKISVLVSAGCSGVWNFCGDKFIVFKK